jgi:hypothetical protein
MARLRAEFESDRTQVGVIKLFSDAGSLVRFYSALGKAANDDARDHGNPHASPLLLYGNTPNGVYDVLGIVPTGAGTPYADTSKYGTAGVIKLDPVSGEALLAKQNGRTGILVHGGSPGGTHLLRRTNGCIRMMDAELADLLDQIELLGENLHSLEVAEIGDSGSEPCEPNGRCGEGDPPPL